MNWSTGIVIATKVNSTVPTGSCQKFWCVEKTNRKERKGRKERIKKRELPKINDTDYYTQN